MSANASGGYATVLAHPTYSREREEAKQLAAIVNLPGDNGLNLKDLHREIDYRLIQQALQKVNGNKAAAAALLRINRTTLVMKLKAYGQRNSRG